MDNRKTVRPAAGRRVRKLDKTLLAEQGESVVWTSFWLNRLRSGDIEIVNDTAEAKPVAEVQPPKQPTKPVKGKEPA